jgi:hypothetical protein
MMQKKKYNDIAISVGVVLGAYFIQKYANLFVIKQAEKDIQKEKLKAYGSQWMDIDLPVQQFLIASGKTARGEKIDINDVPIVQKSDVDKYVQLPIYNPKFYKKYELAVPLFFLAMGIALNQQKKYPAVKNVGNGLIGFGLIRGIFTYINKTPKTFDMMYAQSINLDSNPNKFYSGYVYDTNKK